MPSNLNEIVLSLPKLSKEELHQLKKRVDAYLALGGGTGGGGAGGPSYSVVGASFHSAGGGAPVESPRSEISDEMFVLGVICDTHFKLSGGKYTVGMLRKQSRTMSALRTHLPGLLHYLQNVDKAQRPGFLALCVEMVYHNLQHLKLPANPAMIVQHLARIPSLVDTHFPSYCKNGLLRHIIRMK